MRPTIRAWLLYWLQDPRGAFYAWRWWAAVDQRKRRQLGAFDLRQIAAWEALFPAGRPMP